MLDAIDSGRKDSLTGVYDRGAIMKELDLLMRDDGGRFFVTMVDVDDMKVVNDRDGHPAGDALIIQVAQRLTGIQRAIVGRYGGDEFIVVTRSEVGLPGWEDYLRDGFRDFRLPNGQPASVSFGSACWPLDADTAEDLIALADERLYVAKSGRRNRRLHVA